MDSNDNFDARLQAMLGAQTAELDRLPRRDDNLLNLIQGSFKAGLSQLVVIMYVVAIMLAVVILNSGYQYFGISESDKMFWAMVLLLSFQAQIATKQWIWSEMNRASSIKEIKRLQLFIEHSGAVV